MMDYRRLFIAAALSIAGMFFCITPASPQQQIVINDSLYLFPAPDNATQWPAWRDALARWRTTTRQELAYDGAAYKDPAFQWAASAYSCGFIMLCDEQFLDPRTGRYTEDRLLALDEEKFGGYDAVVLWQAYPRIGIDDRNQYDFYRDLPGGLDGFRRLVGRLHARGIRVFIAYNPWDTGTRREDVTDAVALARMLEATDSDGIFLDTMDKAQGDLREQMDAVRPGLVMESELKLPLAEIPEHHLSWSQNINDSPVPGVLRNRWFEPRHMQHQIQRWADDHTVELQMAWMNGSGMLVWENVFGSMQPWSERDRSILRAMLPVQRRYNRLLTDGRWTPAVPTEMKDVFANLWEGDGIRLWTLVNRSTSPVSGTLLSIVPGNGGERYYDLINGREISGTRSGGSAQLSGTLPPRGIGAIVSGASNALGADFQEFLHAQAGVRKRDNFDASTKTLKTTLRPVSATRKYTRNALPAGMAVIDVKGEVDIQTTVIARECGFYDEPLDSWKGHLSPRPYTRRTQFHPYAIDLTPVTNAQFAKFLRASSYRPAHPENFLKHWVQGAPPRGQEDHPVTYVDLDDARAYAAWAGKRLPTEEEWQYAAAGPQGNEYPWGAAMEAGRCNDGEHSGTTPVTAFASGRSPFGCYDMCGNTWEWTESERSDDRTRFCMLKGGAWFAAAGSHWYTPGGPQPTHRATKFLMTWPGLDRCATIGFRCVADIQK